MKAEEEQQRRDEELKKAREEKERLEREQREKEEQEYLERKAQWDRQAEVQRGVCYVFIFVSVKFWCYTACTLLEVKRKELLYFDFSITKLLIHR